MTKSLPLGRSPPVGASGCNDRGYGLPLYSKSSFLIHLVDC
jgi:hypothetical protein